MHQRDYLLRMIKSFNDAIKRIMGCLENEDIKEAKEILSNSYAILGFSKDFKNKKLSFYKNYFGDSNDDYEKMDAMSQLLYLESRLCSNIKKKKSYLIKAKFLSNLCNEKSSVFSLERENRMVLIDNDLFKCGG